MPAPPPPEERIGFAAVALGRLSLANRLAFSGSKKARLFTGSDGTHVGTVDQIYGERIKLTKTDRKRRKHRRLIDSNRVKLMMHWRF